MRLALLVAAAMLATCGCASLGKLFSEFDDQCVEGQLTPLGASLLNSNVGAVDWHAGYIEMYGGAQAGDRVFSAHCSEAIKAASGAASGKDAKQDDPSGQHPE